MNVKIQFTYLSKEKVVFESEWLPLEKANRVIRDLSDTSKINEIQVIDEKGMVWTPKEARKLLEVRASEPHNIRLYFDASFDQATGDTGVGYVLYYNIGESQIRLRRSRKLSNIEHSSEAEYIALYHVFDLIEEEELTGFDCTIYGDAKGVIMQMIGEWPCFDENLNRWLDRTEERVKKLKLQPSYRYIERKQNIEAHRLSKKGMEGIEQDSKLERNGEEDHE
ncbi:MAG TPA: reverse transcriptase-like protein [Bacillus sp. (in: firmicutes)]|uniref:reverse transcriptase-like protein n=1 Tax=Bacillus litorisediminis TaxID=2922713 RepID=UPI001FAE2366|nr:reverse transcriptase-like protein [Bacillus litorisediminis]HWO76333.1 reverse transcriptase-like protein [Bacillus sp. (in: firmicutes)]